MKKLYVKQKRQKSIKKFIESLIVKEVRYMCLGFDASYHDKKCTNKQCLRGRFRSLDDMYYIVKTEYPSATPEKVLKCYLELDGITIKNTTYYPTIGYCPDMKKQRLFFYGTKIKISGFDHYTIGESKYTFQKYLPKIFKNYEEYNKLLNSK